MLAVLGMRQTTFLSSENFRTCVQAALPTLKGRITKKLPRNLAYRVRICAQCSTGILAKAFDCLDFFLFLLRSEQITPKIIEENNLDRGYAILGEMVGSAESDSTDGSVNHDELIYDLDSKP